MTKNTVIKFNDRFRSEFDELNAYVDSLVNSSSISKHTCLDMCSLVHKKVKLRVNFLYTFLINELMTVSRETLSNASVDQKTQFNKLDLREKLNNIDLKQEISIPMILNYKFLYSSVFICGCILSLFFWISYSINNDNTNEEILNSCIDTPQSRNLSTDQTSTVECEQLNSANAQSQNVNIFPLYPILIFLMTLVLSTMCFFVTTFWNKYVLKTNIKKFIQIIEKDLLICYHNIHDDFLSELNKILNQN